MTCGIGLFAPSLVLLPLLGMSPTASFPMMMGACAFFRPAGERPAASCARSGWTSAWWWGCRLGGIRRRAAGRFGGQVPAAHGASVGRGGGCPLRRRDPPARGLARDPSRRAPARRSEGDAAGEDQQRPHQKITSTRSVGVVRSSLCSGPGRGQGGCPPPARRREDRHQDGGGHRPPHATHAPKPMRRAGERTGRTVLVHRGRAAPRLRPPPFPPGAASQDGWFRPIHFVKDGGRGGRARSGRRHAKRESLPAAPVRAQTSEHLWVSGRAVSGRRHFGPRHFRPCLVVPRAAAGRLFRPQPQVPRSPGKPCTGRPAAQSPSPADDRWPRPATPGPRPDRDRTPARQVAAMGGAPWFTHGAEARLAAGEPRGPATAAGTWRRRECAPRGEIPRPARVRLRAARNRR